MALKNSTFPTNDVRLFLSKQYPYAAKCFAEDMLKHGDLVESILVENWLRRYFPSNTARTIYRKLEASVYQMMDCSQL
jgi:hypothetical protein